MAEMASHPMEKMWWMKRSVVVRTVRLTRFRKMEMIAPITTKVGVRTKRTRRKMCLLAVMMKMSKIGKTAHLRTMGVTETTGMTLMMTITPAQAANISRLKTSKRMEAVSNMLFFPMTTNSTRPITTSNVTSKSRVSLTSESSEQHESDGSIEYHILHEYCWPDEAGLCIGHSPQTFDMSHLAVEGENYIDDRDVDYSDYKAEDFNQEGEYTYPKYTTCVETSTYHAEEVHVKKGPGLIRRYTDKTKASWQDEENREKRRKAGKKAIYILQAGAGHTKVGRVVNGVYEGGSEIPRSRGGGKKVVGKTVAKVAVKVAVKALFRV
ncbi:hypothetical protein EK21DRAFT_89929 [Setomelanomma holmii]|uniref:Uncharacterized protein n=1 Tax=Setomelanomma holmii TaxID=210430 RepID=A0A9P4H8A0_9PLEO|nr:hypothetical protein EK21DRAFT_89929 [Setomelanomma holmii]